MNKNLRYLPLVTLAISVGLLLPDETPRIPTINSLTLQSDVGALLALALLLGLFSFLALTRKQ